MYHRVVSFLLMPTLFLQGLCVAHPVGGTCAHAHAGHESRPHLHLCMIGLYHHHDEDHPADEKDASNNKKEQHVAKPAQVERHDDDAVYLPEATMQDRHLAKSAFASGPSSAPTAIVSLVGGGLTTAPVHLLMRLPPLLPFHKCPIYLHSSALLI
jgi:hypothetical protein